MTEAVSLNPRRLHKITIAALKVIPMLLALTTLLNQTLSFFGIDLEVLGYIGGVSLLPMIFLYIASYCFQFCSYHRMFLHYIVVINVLSYIDMVFGIPINDFNLLILYTSIALLFMLLIVVNIRNERNKENNK